MAGAMPGPGVYTIPTPYNDDYDEDTAVAADIIEAVQLPQGLQGGGLPLAGGANVPAPVSRFRALPLSARLGGARAAGAARLGFALPAEPFSRSAVGRPLSVGAGMPVQFGGLDEGGFLVVRYDVPGPVLRHERVVAPEPCPPPGGAASPDGEGLAALAASLGGPAAAGAPAGARVPPAAAGPPVPDAAAAPAGALAGSAAAVATAPGPAGGGGVAGAPVHDLRVQAFGVDSQGARCRVFRAAVTILTVTPFADWPVRGPRALLWVSKFIVANDGSPVARHNRLMAEARLNGSEPGVEVHLRVCMAVETAACYGQLNITEIASFERLGRSLQVQDERHRVRVMGSEDIVDSHFFLGSDLARGNACVAPQLQDWIAQELAREVSAMKERRRAREERIANRQPRNTKKAGDKEQG
ncbi:unnamed protein product [Prorocentrum cordatum]|uniref:Uncharacterized protein n=1 Tax=Prorocentrum cordatum TaxID=2364126 RepID=A0ABN9VIN5_9DINO|nr:unnamed protein product [Polarella glacialis]